MSIIMNQDFSNSHNQETGNLRDFLHVLFKHQSKILIIFLTTIVTVTLLSFLVPPTYEAKSMLLVKFGREYINRPEVGDTQQPTLQPLISPEEIENSEIAILTSPDLIEKVITTLKVENIYPDFVEDTPSGMTPLQASVIKFQKNLTTEGIKKSNVIEVVFHDNNPQIAATAINLLVTFYKEKHLELFSEPNSSFLEHQLVVYEKKLKDSEIDLENFKQKNRVFSLDEQRNLLFRQRTELDTALKNTQARTDELSQRLSSLKIQLKGITGNNALYTQTDRDKIIVEARSKLLALELQEKDLLLKYSDNNLLITNIHKQINLVQEFLGEQEADISNKVKTGNVIYQAVTKDIISTGADFISQQANNMTIGHQLNQLDDEIKSFNLVERTLTNLKRDRDANERNYLSYLAKVAEARISDDMNRNKMANISIINAASVPAKPIKPKKLLNILLSIVLGAVSGIGFAFLSEYMSNGISTPKNAEKRLGLPVLTTVPYKQ